MFRVTGKQRFGVVYRNGKPIVTCRKGVSYTDSAEDTEYPKNRGFTVEGDKPAVPDPLSGMSAKELIAYAQDHGIDLTGVPNRPGKILAAIRAVEPLPAPEVCKEKIKREIKKEQKYRVLKKSMTKGPASKRRSGKICKTGQVFWSVPIAGGCSSEAGYSFTLP